MNEAEIQSLRALVSSIIGLAMTAQSILDGYAGVTIEEVPEQPKRGAFLGADDPPPED
jgi:hypothetical protein